MAKRNPPLTKRQTADILKLYNEGWTPSELQAKYKRCKSTIWRITSQANQRTEQLATTLATVNHAIKQESPPLQQVIFDRAAEIEKIRDATITGTSAITELTNRILNGDATLGLQELQTAQNVMDKAYAMVTPRPSTLINNQTNGEDINVKIKFITNDKE